MFKDCLTKDQNASDFKLKKPKASLVIVRSDVFDILKSPVFEPPPPHS